MSLNAFDADKKRKLEEISNTTVKEGVSENQQFPNVTLRNASDQEVKLHTLLKRKTVIVIQPGASHTDQWKGRDEELKEWKTIPGAAGCTDQLKDYVKHFEEFEAEETDIIFILANKSAENLQDIINTKNVKIADTDQVKFQVLALTPSAIAELKKHQYPFFDFPNAQKVKVPFPNRETFLLNEDYSISKVMGRKLDSPELCKDEADRTLAEMGKSKLKLK